MPDRTLNAAAWQTLAVGCSYVALTVGHGAGVAGSLPLWVLLVVFTVLSFIGLEPLQRRLAAGCGRRLQLRTALLTSGGAALVYALGWGGVLAPALLISFAAQVRVDGMRCLRPTLLWAALWLTAGETAVHQGLLPSALDPRTSHVLTALQGAGMVVMMLSLAQTESARTAAEQLVERNARRFQALVEESSDVVLVLDRDLRVRYASPSLVRVVGRQPEQVLGRDALDVAHPEDRPRLQEAFVGARPGAPTFLEVRARHADDTFEWLDVTVRDLLADDDVEGYVVNYRDVTERRELEDQLRRRAAVDALTGLANRATLQEALERALSLGPQTGLLLVDLDDFKSVNDTHGHAVGDAVLVEVARRLRTAVREGDLVARLGGDEFALLLEDVDVVAAEQAAARVAAVLARPAEVGGVLLPLGGSVGLALHHAGEAGDTLRCRADSALYASKRSGKGGWTAAPQLPLPRPPELPVG
ncbi:MAG: sensor-containing diguanylate cyclase/phosphodiesterase [Frankiales bacterium]|nr:sensor-containing diguanylate cyclase/phosphodiesterase [Frankiales bacterium]